MLDENKIKQIVDETVRKVVLEQQSMQPPVEPSKPKATRVVFEKDTDAQFEVIFSERGFSIHGVRMSFEAISNALNKNYDIILNESGFRLTQVIMTKLMKYENLY